MFTGIVKFYNTKSGFGFIVDDETKKEIYVRDTGLLETITENDKVTFKTKEGAKGMIAYDVKKV
jgi:cold shock protein